MKRLLLADSAATAVTERIDKGWAGDGLAWGVSPGSGTHVGTGYGPDKLSSNEVLLLEIGEHAMPQQKRPTDKDGKDLEFVIIRTARAGCFFGYLEQEIEPATVIMQRARRIWYWSGAASLSQLAVGGTSDPANCKFPEEVKRAKIYEVLEILECTEESRLNLEAVPYWKIEKEK